MAEPIQTATLAYRGLYFALAAIFLFLRVLPLSTEAGGWPGPDLLLCLTCAWLLRRPDYLPALLIAAVFFLDDLLSHRPPGLWSVFVLLGSEFLRRRVSLARELSFPVEWVMVAAVIVGMMIGYRLSLTITLLPRPDLEMSVRQLISTIIAYPVIVVASRVIFDLRKAATGEVDALGRRL